MTEFILYVVIASAWIWGFNALFQEGHVFEKAGDWMDDNLPWWVNKPIWSCAACQSSVHGLLWFFIGLPLCFHDALPIRMLIPFLICLCGVNFVIIKLTTKERIIIDE
jgi:hypothetical protein